VKILRAPWNEDLFRILEGFPDLAHDDEVDACSGALEMLNVQMKGANIYEWYRQQFENVPARTATTWVPLWAPLGTPYRPFQAGTSTSARMVPL